MKYTLTLAHGPNEDVEGGYWQAPNAPPLVFVNVRTLLEAKELFEAWRDDNGLGSGNMTVVSGVVSNAKTHAFIGQFSYNARLWDAPELAKKRKELAILKANPVLKEPGFEDKAKRWNVLLLQARALNLTPAEQVEFIKKGME